MVMTSLIEAPKGLPNLSSLARSVGVVRICSGSRARRTSFSVLRYWICLANWPGLAVTNNRSSGLMKRVGMIEAFARNSIWARQKTIYLYTAIVTRVKEKRTLTAAIRPALFEVESVGLGG